MSRPLPCLLAGVLALALTPAPAAPRRAPARRAPGGPPSPRVARLRIEPAWIALDGPGAAQQLLLTAVLADGSTVDLTPRARLSSSAPGVASLAAGRLEARADGKAVVTARYGKLAARAPVTVTGVRPPRVVSFRIDGRAGETWRVEVFARRLPPVNRWEPVLRLRDPRRAPVRAAVDMGEDCALEYRLPADGPYLIELFDAENRAGGDFSYRLSVRRL